MGTIEHRLESITATLRQQALSSGRDPETITLIAVSKTHPVPAIEAALAAGQHVFGENRVQEAATKFPALKARFPDLELHLIGPLQTNKVAQAVGLFDVIQTLDRPKLAQALAKESLRQGRMPRLYIEVNTGEEHQKAGVTPDETAPFLTYCQSLGLKIDGLMCIPPHDLDPAPFFDLLARLGARLGLEHLSMGMSADFDLAIAHGATEVRVGTAIFGPPQKA